MDGSSTRARKLKGAYPENYNTELSWLYLCIIEEKERDQLKVDGTNGVMM